MTPYLATIGESSVNPATYAFCAVTCRARYFIHWERMSKSLRADDSYEFDETCASCGSLIKASK